MNPWRLVSWSNETGRVVKELACHIDELGEVLQLPFPAGACCRDAVMELTNFLLHYQWFRRRWLPVKVGDYFQEVINQGTRDCQVVAVDEHMGHFLYEYEMPNGRTYLRDHTGRPINRNRLSKRWQALLED